MGSQFERDISSRSRPHQANELPCSPDRRRPTRFTADRGISGGRSGTGVSRNASPSAGPFVGVGYRGVAIERCSGSSRSVPFIGQHAAPRSSNHRFTARFPLSRTGRRRQTCAEPHAQDHRARSPRRIAGKDYRARYTGTAAIPIPPWNSYLRLNAILPSSQTTLRYL